MDIKSKYEIYKALLSIKCSECPLKEPCEIYERESEKSESICSYLDNHGEN